MIYVFLFGLLALVQAVIVDDTSELVIYSNAPAWQGGTPSQPSKKIQWAGNSQGSASGGTWHEALFTGSSLTFKFTGTAVRVVGIIPKVRLDTNLAVTIDGGARVTFSHQVADVFSELATAEEFIYGVEVFSTTGLSPTSHTLLLSGYTASFLFGLDYIEYTPADPAATTQSTTTGQTTSSQSVSGSTGTETTGTTTSLNATSGLTIVPVPTSTGSSATDLPTIPPSDSRIVYESQKWATNTSCNMESMVTSALGAGLSFQFTGPDLWIYTATEPQGGRYQVFLGTSNLGVIDTAGAACKTEAPYHIGGLGNSPHTIKLTSVAAASGSAGEVAFLGFRLSESEQQVGSSPSQGGEPNTTAIIAGTVGGAVALALLLFGVWVFRRRDRRDPSISALPFVNRELPAFADLPYGAPLSEKQRLANAEREAMNAEQHERAAPRSPLPPSFRTRAASILHPQGNARLSYSTRQDDVREENLAPPYVGDVLARPDARNLSETDVDVIARRLAEVMRLQNEARGGPGLLRERVAPPRELLDQLVGEHLSAREDRDQGA